MAKAFNALAETYVLDAPRVCVYAAPVAIGSPPMVVDAETLRLECLREAVKVATCEIPLNMDVIDLAKKFANFVLGLEYDEEADEWVGDDSELQPKVRAYDEEGQEL